MLRSYLKVAPRNHLGTGVQIGKVPAVSAFLDELRNRKGESLLGFANRPYEFLFRDHLVAVRGNNMTSR